MLDNINTILEVVSP